MKKLMYLIVLALILGLVLTGCFLSNVGQVPTNEQSGITYLTKGGPQVVTLYAGQDIPVGTVEGTIDGTSLTIIYETTGCWEMSETHLHVASSVEGIPHTQKGNPVPGQFDYFTSHNPWVSTYTYNITLEEELEPCEKLYIAAHADVKCLAEHCIDFEDYDEKDPVSLETTPNGPVNFYMTDYKLLSKLEVGDYALLAPSGSFPVVSSPATNTNPEDTYPNIVAFTTGGPQYKVADDIVLDDHGTGAGGNMLTDPQDTSQIELMWHAYSQFLGIVIDVTGLNWVEDMSLVTVDLDHGEIWHFLYFDADGFLIYKDTIEAGVDNYDGEAFPISWTDDKYSIAKVVVFGEMNNNDEGIVGYAIDNICITSAVQEETAWGDGERFVDKGNWATYFTYTVPCCPCIDEISGNIEVLDAPPTHVGVGSLENDEYVRVWKEFEGTLEVDLCYDLDEGLSARTDGPPNVDPFISAGTEVCIYYVHLDNEGPSSTVQHTGQITFGADILGLIISGGNLGTFKERDLMFTADISIGNSGTTYPDTTGVNYWRGFDVHYGSNLDDAVFSGPTVDFTMWVVNAHDSFRVILPMVP